MPYLNIETNVPVDKAKKVEICKNLVNILAEQLGKPASFVMVKISDDLAMTFGGDDANCAACSLYSVGTLDAERNTKVSGAVFEVLDKELGVGGEKYYLNFFDLTFEGVGYKGTTLKKIFG
eukprot:snap_masked-scaffold_8-processed-gene-13.39-mRNA-1 protein AED:0.98 eAED:1.00 QI:0/-1/0/1/-1/1/1/0/120